MRQKIIGMDPDDILNMDQTPIPYSYHSNRTLEKKGVKTIHVRSSTADTKRAMLAATVTASGKLLKPMLIFKGQANGRIECRVSDLPGKLHVRYATQGVDGRKDDA